MFSEEEIRVAGALAEEFLEKGADCEFAFLTAFDRGRLCAFTCFGAVVLTRHSYDLYWIAVDPEYQKTGLGREILARTIAIGAAADGQWLFAETSGLDDYAPARRFYLRAGFEEVARIPDFYKPGDAKVIYRKFMQP